MDVHQLTQGFSHGDATSNMARKIREILREDSITPTSYRTSANWAWRTERSSDA